MNEDAKIGLQIKKARVEANMTQTELGKFLGVTWEMISRYENGKSSSRKNLEQISDALKKPIQYFFGVEEAPLRDEVKRLADLINKKGGELLNAHDIPFINQIGKNTLLKALKTTEKKYKVPQWIRTRFDKVFALKLTGIKSEDVDISRGDVGYFTQEHVSKKGKYVLVRKGKGYVVKKYSKVVRHFAATLIAIERKYV
jgi:transcriptional regulator with XRE-family HTH domain